MPRKKRRTADDGARERLGMVASGGAETEEAAEPPRPKFKLPEAAVNPPAWVKGPCIGIPFMPPTGKALMTAAQVVETWAAWHDVKLVAEPVFWHGIWRAPHPALNTFWVAEESKRRGISPEEYIALLSAPNAEAPAPVKSRGRKPKLEDAPIGAEDAGPVFMQEALIDAPLGRERKSPAARGGGAAVTVEKRQTAGAGLVQEVMF